MTDGRLPLAEYVSDHREDLLASTLDLVGHDTTNPPGETRALVDHLEESLASVPVDLDRVTVDPAKPNLVATVPGESDRSFLYVGHLDTVPFDRVAWSHDPLGERVEERVYGRGATDMKGQVAAMVLVLRAFATGEATPPVDLQFAFVSDEEVGGDAGLPALLGGGHLAADACLIGEPTCELDRPAVAVADRGSIWLTLEATGEAAHGSRPVLGVNAIDRLYGAVETLRAQFGSRKLALDPAVGAVVEESVDYYAPTMGEDAARALFESPSLNLGTIEGGEAINTVPESARAEVDIRLTAGVETQQILAKIRECLESCEGVRVSDVSWSVGTAEPIDSPLVEAVSTTVRAVTDARVYRRSGTGGGDAKDLRDAGVPTVEFGAGPDTVHAVDEYTTADALVTNAAVYAALPFEWHERATGRDPSEE